MQLLFYQPEHAVEEFKKNLETIDSYSDAKPNLFQHHTVVWFIMQPLHQAHHLQTTTGWTLVDLDPVRALKLLSGFDKVISSLNLSCSTVTDDKRITAKLDYNIPQNQSRQSQRIPNVSVLHWFVIYYCYFKNYPYLALFVSFLFLNTVGRVKQCTVIGSFSVLSRTRWVIYQQRFIIRR